MAVKPPAIVALTAAGAALGRRIQATLPGALLHGYVERARDADVTFEDATRHLRVLFSAGHPIIAICAAGIAIRALAPVLKRKQDEPPVLAVAEDGSAIVPLLGGHRGGNALARRLAAALGGIAAVTTAGDVALSLSLDEPPPGWKIANPEALKPIAAAMLACNPVGLRVEGGNAGWLTGSGFPFRGNAIQEVLVTYRTVASDARTLVYHPPVLALGVGCERNVAPEELIELAEATLSSHHLAPHAVACVVSLDVKADEAAVHALGAHLGVPVRFFDTRTLASEESRLHSPSEAVRRAVGVSGVAEAAALASTGRNGRLLVPKQRSARATCAVALASDDIDPARIGRAQGRLSVVGIGPGTGEWRTPEADAALEQATDIVGYGLYLDLLGQAISGKQRHESALGEEETRVQLALALAAQGQEVALVSSGDAGIYGLAALVFELMERGDDPAWSRIAVRVCPGISALQAAASRAGAPLGHDFCVISLSDLLTPWPEIERRLHAAADGDFVIALYNPASMRRRDQLRRARDVLLAQRPPETPVIIARNLGRREERVERIPLSSLDVETVDMRTLVLIGSSRTRVVSVGTRAWVYTPRGYASKAVRDPPIAAAPMEER